MRIDRKTLNLVIPITDGVKTVKDPKTNTEKVVDKVVAYVHAAPISRDIFELYFLPLSQTFAKIYSDGLGVVAGPRVAALLLKKTAQDMGMWEGPGGVEAGLVQEIKRLANVLIATDKGWEERPYYQAVQAGELSPDDASEVDNALAFFTVVSAIHKKSELPLILEGAARLWGAETTSFNCTEFKNSLTTSTPPAPSGPKAPALSIPS